MFNVDLYDFFCLLIKLLAGWPKIYENRYCNRKWKKKMEILACRHLAASCIY